MCRTGVGLSKWNSNLARFALRGQERGVVLTPLVVTTNCLFFRFGIGLVLDVVEGPLDQLALFGLDAASDGPNVK